MGLGYHLNNAFQFLVVFHVVQVCLQWVLSLFALSGNVFISSLFLKDSLSEERIIGWIFFSFTILNMSFYLYLAFIISDEKSTINCIAVPLHMKLFFSCSSQDFLFVFEFQQFEHHMPRCVSLFLSYSRDSLIFSDVLINIFQRIWKLWHHFLNFLNFLF